MLAIRMQRVGRRGHAHFRMIVQDSRWSPKSGKFVDLIGSYDPHTKGVSLAKDKAEHYLKNGAQPSERVAELLKREGVKLPDWVAKPTKKQGEIRNAEKLRKNRPADTQPKPEKQAESSDVESAKAEEAPVESAPEAVSAEKPDSDDQPAELPDTDTK